MQDWERLGEQITEWISDYATSNGITTLVVGVSGGIDSVSYTHLTLPTSIQV